MSVQDSEALVDACAVVRLVDRDSGDVLGLVSFCVDPLQRPVSDDSLYLFRAIDHHHRR